MIGRVGTCFLKRFIGAPKHLLDCLVFNRYKKALFEEYEASDNDVMGSLIRQQDTTASASASRRGGDRCTGHGQKMFYCYEDPNFGLMVVRPAVRISIDVVTDHIQLKLLPDYPKSGYPQFLIEKWLRDYESWKIYTVLMVMYGPLTLLLSYVVAVVGNVLLVHQYYPLCIDDIEFGNSCYFWNQYLVLVGLVLLAGYVSAKRSYQIWKYQMLEKEICGHAARELLRQLSIEEDSAHNRPNLYNGPEVEPLDERTRTVTAPLIARV